MTSSPFAPIEAAPADPILGLTEAFRADPNPDKVNLGVGVYQDESGKVPVLDVVLEAERRLLDSGESKTYLPIDGLPAYDRAVQQILFGDDAPVVSSERAVTAQAPGGTGALRIGADLLKRFHPKSTVWISDPSWENHPALFEAAGFTVRTYPYYDPRTHGLDFEGMRDTLRAVPDGDIVVLHACCHNPTGVDLFPDQWREIVALFEQSGRIAFLDFAYQGFGEGIDEDARAVRLFAAANIPFLAANSFSKSFSLYSERVGALSLVTASAEEAGRALSQLKRVARSNYSNPPAHGARVVAAVLNDASLRQRWEEALAGMRNRIRATRCLFVQALAERGHDFSFISLQRGMFSFSGLTREQVHRLRREYSLYIVDSGRICVAAMNRRNVPVVADAIARILK